MYKECTHKHTITHSKGEFKIHQIPFAYDWLNGNTTTVCHQITIRPFGQLFCDCHSADNTQTQTELFRVHLKSNNRQLSYFPLNCISISFAHTPTHAHTQKDRYTVELIFAYLSRFIFNHCLGFLRHRFNISRVFYV